MVVPEGLAVNLFAAEPDVRQPILVKCDDRGRIWTIQYLQYPNPAGLKRVRVDRYSRTVYDRVPEPPPRDPRGADWIMISADFAVPIQPRTSAACSFLDHDPSDGIARPLDVLDRRTDRVTQRFRRAIEAYGNATVATPGGRVMAAGCEDRIRNFWSQLINI
jgi:hypothetical protein